MSIHHNSVNTAEEEFVELRAENSKLRRLAERCYRLLRTTDDRKLAIVERLEREEIYRLADRVNL